MATIAHFKFCMRTRRHAGGLGPSGRDTPELWGSGERLDHVPKAQRNSKETDKGSTQSCWSPGWATDGCPAPQAVWFSELHLISRSPGAQAVGKGRTVEITHELALI